MGGRSPIPARPPPASAHLLSELFLWPLPSAAGAGGKFRGGCLCVLGFNILAEIKLAKKTTQNELKESAIHVPVGWTFSAGKGWLLWNLTLGLLLTVCMMFSLSQFQKVTMRKKGLGQWRTLGLRALFGVGDGKTKGINQ